MSKDFTTEYFDCECKTPEHTLRFTLDNEYGDLYLDVFLRPDVWHKRLWYAIKYVFGLRCDLGAFGGWMFDPNDLERLVNFGIKCKQIRSVQVSSKTEKNND